MAMIGRSRRTHFPEPPSRIIRVASKPSISGIRTSIRTRSYGAIAKAWTASRPLPTPLPRYPSFSISLEATFWFTTLSSATRILILRRPSPATVCRVMMGRSAESRAPFRRPSAVLRHSLSCDCLTGLGRQAAKPAAGPAPESASSSDPGFRSRKVRCGQLFSS